MAGRGGWSREEKGIIGQATIRELDLRWRSQPGSLTLTLWSHDRHDNFKRAGETRKQARIRPLNTGGDDGGRGDVARGPPLCPCGTGSLDRAAAGPSTTAIGGQASYLYLQGGEIEYGVSSSLWWSPGIGGKGERSSVIENEVQSRIS